MLQELYNLMLRKAGFKIVATAYNGEEAVNKFRAFEKKPDLILMDNRMPIKNGIDAAKEIIEINGGSRIIVASADLSIKEYSLSLGIISFVAKPFTYDELINTLNMAMRYS
jgi:two-component system chemotaxis response regulator CheY